MIQRKKGFISGIANHRSLATAVAKLMAKDHDLICSYLPDGSGKAKFRVEQACDGLNVKIFPCDMTSEKDWETLGDYIESTWGSLDFALHGAAFAPLQDLKGPVHETSREGFLTTMESSVFSFLLMAKHFKKLMPTGGALLTLTYLGSQKVVTGYNVMGLAKAALESSVRYLAKELGPNQIRVNAISAGPVKTLAASAIPHMSDLLLQHGKKNPLEEATSQDHVAKAGAFLLGADSPHITGHILYVDGGAHILGPY